MSEGVSIVVPTLGRPSLTALLDRLRPQLAGRPAEVIVVDDRRAGPPLDPPGLTAPGPAPGPDGPPAPAAPHGGWRVLAGPGRGPAAARNVGWRAARYPWVAFLDDDVLPAPDWLAALAEDLRQPADVGGVQGRLRVPRPADGGGDWAATTAGLERARWATADMAYRRAALASVHGFDERFPRAYREDADLAYRVSRAGWRLVVGARRTTHPVRPESAWVSLRTQRGNADDALLRRRYGRDWHRRLSAPAGRRHRHAAIVAAALSGLGLAALPRRGARVAAALAGLGWLAGTAEFAMARLRAAPAARRELGPLLATSALIPPLALAHWLHGWWRARGARHWPLDPREPAATPSARATWIEPPHVVTQHRS